MAVGPPKSGGGLNQEAKLDGLHLYQQPSNNSDPVAHNWPLSPDTSADTPAARMLPLLICSIGNPGAAYANTLHSAGHTVLNCLAAHLGQPSFHRERTFGNGLVSKVGDWTLWQSTSYMNESGKGVRAAWQAWSRSLPDGEGRLVILHDELEKQLGSITLRTAPGASAKGHNGLKSIKSLIGDVPFARIGIGIGRPISRESDDVARYVLRKMTHSEKTSLEHSIQKVVENLRCLEQA